MQKGHLGNATKKEAGGKGGRTRHTHRKKQSTVVGKVCTEEAPDTSRNLKKTQNDEEEKDR